MKVRADKKQSKAMANIAAFTAVYTTALIAAGGCLVIFSVQADAQFAQPLQPPDQAVQYTAPYQAPTQAPAPPIGSGSIPPSALQGDTGAPPAVVNPGADPTDGVGLSNFTVGQSHDPGIMYLYHQQQPGSDGVPRGIKLNMTINPATLDADTWSQIQAITGSPAPGQAATNVTVNDAQLAQINQILAPYPPTVTENGRTVISSDAPLGANQPQPSNTFSYDGLLPTVPAFCRYLIIAGVVLATVWMALAAYSMVLGHPYAGSRVIGTAAGLMLLLCAFTIWKIVRMNTYNANTYDDPQALLNYEHRPSIDPVYPSQVPGLPPTPAAPTGRTSSSGLPVQPLYGKGN